MHKILKQSILILFTGFSVAMLVTEFSLAASMEGFYVSGDLAANWLKTQTYKVNISNAPVGTTVDLRSKTGWGGGLAVGSQSGPYRLEAALDFLSNKTKNGTANLQGGWPGTPSLTTSGRVTATPLLINGYYDFRPTALWTPYLGIGLGVANINVNVSAVEPISDTFARVHDNSTEFAYQGIAGVSWKVTNRMKVNLDYRYLRTETATFNVTDQVPDFFQQGVGVIKGHYESSRVLGGVAYYFD